MLFDSHVPQSALAHIEFCLPLICIDKQFCVMRFCFVMEIYMVFPVMQGLSFDSLCSSRCHPLLWCLDWWWRGSDIPWHVVEEESLWNMTRDQIDRLLGSTQLSLSEKYTLKSDRHRLVVDHRGTSFAVHTLLLATTLHTAWSLVHLNLPL